MFVGNLTPILVIGGACALGDAGLMVPVIQNAMLIAGLVTLVTAVETVGDLSGITEGGLGREATDKELSGGVACDGIGNREVTIVAVSLGLGYGLGATANVLAQMPAWVVYIFGGSGIVPAAICAIILNIVLKKDKDDEPQIDYVDPA